MQDSSGFRIQAKPGLNRGHAGAKHKALRLRPLHTGVIAACTAMLAMPAFAAGPLPVPCAGACATNLSFITSGAATYSTAGNSAVINQTTDRAILNWQSFNIDPGYAVQFVQPSATSAALNRIYDANPTTIAGSLTANGQVYLINQNGIIFANGAQVNVGALTASTLNITDSQFTNGILSGTQQNNGTNYLPAFTLGGGNSQSYVVVNAGAELHAASGGRIMLLAPNVANNGIITTPDGQTILAAGSQVFLAASQDPALRGILVEVDATGTSTNTAATGCAANACNGGQIIAQHGNVTLTGLMVNQSGMIAATTSVSANGSIYLVAGSNAAGSANPSILGFGNLEPTSGGTLTLASGSVTEVTPDSADTGTATDAQQFLPSAVGLVGSSIDLLGTAKVIAPSGNVSLLASANPTVEFNEPAGAGHSNPVDGSRIYLDSGSVIDVSGVQNVAVPVTRNLVSVNLTANELADDPLLRTGFLHGQTVVVDITKGTALFDLTPFASNIGRGVAEKSTTGGTITLNSEGDVILRSGSTLNVSGGSVAYQPGYGNPTKLLGIDGKVYDLSTAPKDMIYVGFANQYSYTDPKWGVTQSWNLLFSKNGTYLPGYLQGASAGTINLIAPHVIEQGTLLAGTIAGPYQRTTSTLPLGGLLNIGDASQVGVSGLFQPDFRAPSILLSDDIDFLSADFDQNSTLTDAQKNQATISPGQLTAGGFDRLGLYSTGAITVPAGTTLNLEGNGAALTGVTLGSAINIGGNIVAPSGSVALASKYSGAPANIILGAGAQILTSGEWINDYEDTLLNPLAVPTAPLFINGGNVALNASGSMLLGSGSLIDASGGGAVSSTQKFTAGSGGSIALAANQGNPFATTSPTSLNGSVQLGGMVRSYAFAQGGALSISATTATIGGSPSGAAGELYLTPSFFTQGGFGSFSITGQNGLLISSGTTIAPVMQTLLLDSSFLTQPTGGDLFGFSSITTLPIYSAASGQAVRAPANVSFATTTANIGGVVVAGLGDLNMAAGSAIITDPGASVTLSAREDLTINGTIDAPAGKIGLNVAPSVVIGGGSSDSEGYLPNQALTIGAQARLLATGYAEVSVDSRGLNAGKVLDAGQININATKGYVVTEAGSVMDVSGVSASVDVLSVDAGGTSVTPTTVAGNAGAISIHAREGMVLKGSMIGRAAPVNGAAGGSLTIGLDLYNRASPYSPNDPDYLGSGLTLYPTGDRDLIVTSADASTFSSTPSNGVAEVSIPGFAAGGFDSLTLISTDIITLNDSLTLGARRSIILDAPALASNAGVTAAIAAPYVALGNSNGLNQPGLIANGIAGLTAGTPSQTIRTPGSGNAVLDVSAQLIDIRGNSVLSGFGSADFTSSGDIRLTYSELPATSGYGTDFSGSLATTANLTLQAAQIYPTTLAQFTINPTTNPDGSVTTYAPGNVTILANGNAATPLSAGGSLTINASNIDQNGTLRAPFGQITLNGAGSVTLEPGSLTSVSADGLVIPFGATQNGQDWVYQLNINGTTETINAPPSKQIALNAANVNVKAGAVADLSGGGDLYAYEFIAGTGGSKDVLASAGTFAILPSLGAAPAPLDQQYDLGSTLKVGDSIYLSGVPGLAAGMYTLLPARYALLPGAYSIQAVSGYTDIALGTAVKQRDGSMIVSGYRNVAGTDIRDTRTSGFLVTPGNLVRADSEYADSYANSFFPAQALENDTAVPRLPADAGQLQLAATTSLLLNGDFVFGADSAQQGRGGVVSISAPDIDVVDQIGAPTGALQIPVVSLNQLGAETLVLGATFTVTASGDALGTGANTVELSNSAGNPLVAPEIILAAGNQVILDPGSAIEGAGASSSSGENLLVSGNGALLRVASGPQAALTRSGGPFTQGLLQVGDNASISGNSIIFDGAVNTIIASTTQVDAGAVDFSASRINLGNVPNGTTGLNITSGLLAQLRGLTDLKLSSYSSVDIYDGTSLGEIDGNGRPLLASVILDAGALVGHGTQDKTITAGNINLSNINNATYTSTPDGTGQITLVALNNGTQNSGTIAIAAGANTIAGFSTVNLDAARDIQGQSSGTLNVAGNLNLQAARVSAATGANQQIIASGNVQIAATGSGIDLAADGIGAQLAISGSSVVQGGFIDLPAGVLSLEATSGDLTLVDGSLTSATGVSKEFYDAYAFAPAGQINLTSDHGNVNIQSGATVDVSGSAVADIGGGDAGTVDVSAINGTLQMNGNLLANAAAGQRGGSFALDAGSLDFSTLNASLNAGNFSAQQTLRARSGSVTIASSDVVNAADYTLEADSGSITVNGAIDANGDDGGTVALWAQNNLTLNGTINAAAISSTGNGGSVTLGESSTGGVINVGGSINVAGGASGSGGTVLLRAQRNGTDVNIGSSLAGKIAGASEVDIEAFKTYTGTTTSALTATIQSDATNYMTTANVNAIKSRLGISGNSVYHVRPGVEIDSSGDLALSADWNFCGTGAGCAGSVWRYTNGSSSVEPGYLTLRAAGNLNLNNNLTDGFNGTAATSALQNTESWSYLLVGGADLTAADPMTVKAPAAATTNGDVVVASAKVVRTGTGSIDIAAARDFKLTAQTSVVYTAGIPTTPTGIPALYDGLSAVTRQPVVYPDDGGDITISAGRDVNGAASNQLISNWLVRQGTVTNGLIVRDTSWGIAIDQFQEGVATLGGGDITIDAGRDINNLSVMVPTTGWLTGAVGTVPNPANLHTEGGGNLNVVAGRNINSGVFYVDHGDANINAGGAITKTGSAPAYPILALASGDLSLSARDDLTIETVFNPFVLPQSGCTAANCAVASIVRSFFYTYSPNDSVSLTSTAGDLVFDDNISAITSAVPALTNATFSSRAQYNSADLLTYPPTLNAVAMQGDININNLTLYPAAGGNLSLLAANNVNIQGSLNVSEANPAAVANPLLPGASMTTSTSPDVGVASLPATPLHEDDDQPIRIVALAGSISGTTGGNSITFPKEAELYAGEDISNLQYHGKNLSNDDVTSFYAGRDIIYTTARDSITNQLVENDGTITVGGPGQVQLVAGRNIDLGNSIGVVTRGNEDDPRLPAGGATIVAAAGVGINPDGTLRDPDYQDFIARYITGSAGSAPHLYAAELTTYMDGITGLSLTDGEALTDFLALSKKQQLLFIAQVLYAELNQTGIDHNKQGTDYSRGYQAIATLFPGADYQGDINMFFSQLKTEQGGDVDLLAPGGSVVVGLANPPSELNALKTNSNNPVGLTTTIPAAGKLGILILAQGAVHGFAKEDFTVNQSRILTLQGGDIILWASDGDIDAGKGAKTASAAPPPIILTDNSGNVFVNAGGSVSGSGIGQLLTVAGITPGLVNLIAPNGDVNAGEAGLRVAGNLNIAALRVVNASNISVGGTATGVPTVDTGALAGALSGVSGLGDAAKNASDQMTRSLSDSANLKNSFPPIITVQVFCLGGDCQ